MLPNQTKHKHICLYYGKCNKAIHYLPVAQKGKIVENTPKAYKYKKDRISDYTTFHPRYISQAQVILKLITIKKKKKSV